MNASAIQTGCCEQRSFGFGWAVPLGMVPLLVTLSFGAGCDGVEVVASGESQQTAAAGQEAEAKVIASTPAERRDRGDAKYLAFSPDGHTVVEIASEGTTVLRNASTGEAGDSILPPESSAKCVYAAVPVARPVLYRVDLASVELYSIPDGKRLGEIRAADFRIAHAALSDDGRYLILAGKQGPVLLTDATTGTSLGRVENLAGEILALAIAPQGQEMSVVLTSPGGKSSFLQQFTLPTLRERTKLQVHERSLTIRYSPDGRHLAIWEDGNLLVRNADTGRPETIVPQIHWSGLTYSHDGRFLFARPDRSIYHDQSVVCYDAATGLPVHSFDKGADVPFAGSVDLGLSPDGQRLAAIESHGAVVWWPVPRALIAAKKATSPLPQRVPAGAGIVAAADIVHPSRRWQIGQSSLQRNIFAPQLDGIYTLTRSRNSFIIRRWNADTGRYIERTLPLSPAGVPRIGSDDGHVWLSIEGGMSEFWDAAAQRVIASGPTPKLSYAASLKFDLAHDGTFAVATLFNGGLVQLTPVNGRIEIREFVTDLQRISAMAISHDGRRLAVSDDQERCVWLIERETPDKRTKLDRQDGLSSQHALRFTADGEFLVGSHDDRRVIVWSTATGKVVQHITQKEIGRALAVSPDGTQCATYAVDREGRFVAVWNLKTGHLKARLVGAEYAPSSLRFSADGAQVQAVVGRDYLCWTLTSP